ncbi:MAG: CoA ester lyase [Rhodoferax sp.]|nr:CoA ester lyase [Rhodoferax sp.]PIW10176.1 MAG: CoA ester lyase [Comamonadaceae bacterium CG17_big_fil_post_rev_8_21_14_2_50_60_13]PJC12160.1 MAG: CoA ester lyase [Comamonadaceae bacterium CG_4_9_14_0_8_um_filter_60_18]
MIKSLALQAQMAQEFGACVFDVTLDCEDGAPVGGERRHAEMVKTLVNDLFATQPANGHQTARRVAVRVHPVEHPAFAQDVAIVVAGAGKYLSHIMLPKIESVAEIDQAAKVIDLALQSSRRATPLPIHVLVESPRAVCNLAGIAAHARVESISFGLMDFVSAHGGAIAATAMRAGVEGVAGDLDQFSHPLVLRAKLEIASACHAFGKTPSHCVVTEFRNATAVKAAARRASRQLGFTRMWSIHPDQIRPILSAFAPDKTEVDLASQIVGLAQAANWAPISVDGQLHDRASYRYYWQVLERAHHTGQIAPNDPAKRYFES